MLKIVDFEHVNELHKDLKQNEIDSFTEYYLTICDKESDLDKKIDIKVRVVHGFSRQYFLRNNIMCSDKHALYVGPLPYIEFFYFA